MADAAKKRVREKEYIFVIGEHVWVDGTYFDDLNQPAEERYSASCSRAFGIVKRQLGSSYIIDFEDGSQTTIPGRELHIQPKTNPTRVTISSTSRSEELSDLDGSDEDYVPPSKAGDDDGNSSNDDDEQLEEESMHKLKQSEDVYLTLKGKDIFKATFDEEVGDQVHFQTMDEHHGRFFITKVLANAGIWSKFDAEEHKSGYPVRWNLSDIRRMLRTPLSQLGTEATYPTPLPARKRKRNAENWQKNKRKVVINTGNIHEYKNRK